MFSIYPSHSAKTGRFLNGHKHNAWRLCVFILTISALLFGSATRALAEVGPVVVGVSSPLGNGVYGVGQLIPITVTFDLAVTVTGAPQLTLETGATDRVAVYSSGSGTTALTFNYTVQAGDNSPDLDYTDRFALTLNGGTINDSSTGDPADLTLNPPGILGSLGASKDIVIDDGNIPTVTNVTSTTLNGTYGVGVLIPITVTFSEAVFVSAGPPQLTLETGATDQIINYSSGSGSETLIFNYTVQTNDTAPDLDYVDANSLGLNSGTIQDAVANNATLTLPAPGAGGSLGANKDIVIDWDATAVTNVASTATGSHTIGALIPIQVTFSAAVNVTGGPPQLTLETGATDRVANYSSGSGSATLTFNYTVQAGDESTDLDYVDTASLTLNGGSIQNLAASDAVLTLPAPGASGSLGASNNIVIDAVAPETVLESGPASPTSSANASFTFSATDNISDSDFLTFECRVDGGVYSVCVSPQNYTGLADGPHTFQVYAIDELGNSDATPASYAWTIDTTAPNTVIDSSPANPSTSATANFTFHGVDAGSGILNAMCDLDGGGFAACDTLTTQAYTSLADGPHTFQVRTTNNAGLTDATPASFTWTVDASAPTVTINQDAGQIDPTSISAIKFSVVFSEPVTDFDDTSDITLGGSAGATVFTLSGGPTTYTLTVYVSGNADGSVIPSIPAGAATDLAGNPNLASTSTDNSVDYIRPAVIWNQNYRIKYDTWYGLEDVNALAFASGYRKATTGTFTFKPNIRFTSFKWVTYRGPDQGKAQIIVDGVVKATIDLYRATAQWQYNVTISGLSAARHTVVIKPLGQKNPASSGKWVVVDGFKIGATTYDDDMINVPYNDLFSYGSWLGRLDSGSLFGAYRISSVKNATASFSFNGTQLRFVTARGPAYGRAAIYVDGVLKKVVDLYSATQQWQYRVAITGLTPGNHNVVLKVLGTRNPQSTGTGVVCDGFEID